MPQVLAFGVLAHADHVDVRGSTVGQGRRDAGQQSHRPQVDVLAKPLPEREDQIPRRDVIGDARVADRAEVDRVELLDDGEPVLVHHPAGLQVVVAAPGQLGELAAEVALFRRHVENAHPGRNDFLADAVAGNDCNAISLHGFVNSITSSGEPLATRFRTNRFCSSTAIIFGSTFSSVRQKATMITRSPA